MEIYNVQLPNNARSFISPLMCWYHRWHRIRLFCATCVGETSILRAAEQLVNGTRRLSDAGQWAQDAAVSADLATGDRHSAVARP